MSLIPRQIILMTVNGRTNTVKVVETRIRDRQGTPPDQLSDTTDSRETARRWCSCKSTAMFHLAGEAETYTVVANYAARCRVWDNGIIFSPSILLISKHVLIHSCSFDLEAQTFLCGFSPSVRLEPVLDLPLFLVEMFEYSRTYSRFNFH